MKKIFAFTLAEVLITLSILGVVAAITVPSLIKRQHRNEVETKIRKMYSTISHVMDIAEANEGKGYASWDQSLSPEDYAEKYYIPYLNIQKDCIKINYVDSECQARDVYRQDTKTYANTFKTQVILKDEIHVLYFTSHRGSVQYGTGVTFDINGPKGPNAFGKDLFQLYIYPDETTGSYYFGSDNWNKTKKDMATLKRLCTTEYNRAEGYQYCMGWIYANGLKIPKDYPWL